MDPRDRLRPLLDGAGCTVCGALVPGERMRILAHRADLAFVELDCPACSSTTLGMLLAADGPDAGPVLDVAPYGELSPQDEARRIATAPITSDDVHAAHTFLAGWKGDLAGLFGDPGDEDSARSGRSTPR